MEFIPYFQRGRVGQVCCEAIQVLEVPVEGTQQQQGWQHQMAAAVWGAGTGSGVCYTAPSTDLPDACLLFGCCKPPACYTAARTHL
jgi:hypothetical protein